VTLDGVSASDLGPMEEELEERFMAYYPSLDWTQKLASRMSGTRSDIISYQSFSRRAFAPSALSDMLADQDVRCRALGGNDAASVPAAIQTEVEHVRTICAARESACEPLKKVFARSDETRTGRKRFHAWAGPACPHEDDTLWDWISNFAGGATTIHGFSRAFDDRAGPLRRMTWVLLFFASFIFLGMLIENVVLSYLMAETDTQVSRDDRDETFPMLSVCHVSPYRCTCEGLYDAELIQNPESLEMVLPYLCASVLAWKENAAEWMRGAGAPTISDIDLETTRLNAANFMHAINCDNGKYDRQSFVEEMKSGVMSKHSLLAYLGYHKREQLVRYCRSPNIRPGSKGHNCDDDGLWSPPRFDNQYGICHTFNPCLGFERTVGKSCTSDEDCRPPDRQTLQGAECRNGQCACTLCAHKNGENCSIVKEKNVGPNSGVSLVLDTSPRYETVLSVDTNRVRKIMCNVRFCDPVRASQKEKTVIGISQTFVVWVAFWATNWPIRSVLTYCPTCR